MNKKLVTVMLSAAMVAGVITGCGANTQTTTSTTDATDTAGVESQTDATDTSTNFTILDCKTGRDYNISDYVTLCDYKNMKIEYEEPVVSEEDIDSYMDSFLTYRPEYKSTDKQTVENGDYVNIDYCGKKDGVAFDGGTSEGYVLGIGTGTFIPGFEEGLIGVNVGQTVELNLTFPENYATEDLAGADVIFTVTVNEIVEANPLTHDTITDEYVASNFSFTTVSELRDNIRQYLQEQASSDVETSKSNALLEYLKNNCTVAIPDGMQDDKTNEYMAQFENQLSTMQNTNVTDYLKDNYNMSYEEFYDTVHENIAADIETDLILEAIATEMNDTLDTSEFDEYMSGALSSTGLSTNEEIYKIYTTDYSDGEMYIKRRYFIQKTLNTLLETVEFVSK